MNMIFGVIVDTFAEIRKRNQEFHHQKTNVCAICRLERGNFDTNENPRGFSTHIKAHHNVKNYFFYMMMILEQDKDDDDGLEQHVRQCIIAEDPKWFPLKSAMSLDASDVRDPNDVPFHNRHEIKQNADSIKQLQIELFNKMQIESQHLADLPRFSRGGSKRGSDMMMAERTPSRQRSRSLSERGMSRRLTLGRESSMKRDSFSQS